MQKKTRLAGLDLLRFFAAFAVMAFHLAFWSWAPATSTPKSIVADAVSYPELTGFAWWGWVGVEIFFVISGFVIAYSASRATRWEFAKGRFLRLFPGAVVCATITLAVALATHWMSTAELISRYVKTVTFWPLGGWIDGVYWTLGVEVAFYAGVFLLLAIGRFTWLEPIVAAVGIGSTTLWLIYFAMGILTTGTAAFDSRWRELLLGHHGMYFALGVLIWLGTSRGWTIGRLTLVSLCSLGGFLPILAEATDKTRQLGLGHVEWVPIVIWLVAVAALWLSVCFDEQISRTLGKARGTIAMLGLSTYPLYLLHDVVGATALRALLSTGVDRFSGLAISMIGMVLLALGVTLTLEQWFRRYLGTFLTRAAPEPVP